VLDSSAQVKVVIVDSCFSGLAIGRTMGDEMATVVGQLDVKGTYVLTSAERSQVSLALPDERHTAFTGRLLHLMKNGVAGGGEYLTIDTIYTHLLVQMKSEGLSQPQRRAAANAGLVALARNRLFTETARRNLTQRFDEAVALMDGGAWGNASTVLLSVLDDQTQILGADDPDTLHTVQALAHAKGATGDCTTALSMLTELLDRQIEVLGAEHADTLQTRQLLGVGLAESGRWTEGVKVLRELLPDRRRVLGPDHGSVYRTVHVLARTLAVLGEIDEAAALLREAVAGRERLLGANAADTERARRDLTIVARNMTSSGRCRGV
jgi:Tetratricopeptide repeat